MTSGESRLIIRGLLEDIEQGREFVADHARRAGFGENIVHNCQLAVDETCTNIIEHGYRLQGADKAIQIVCGVNIPFFDISIMDEGPPFNPLNHAEPDRSAALDQRSEGGWGIYFIKQMMDEVSYERRGNYNCLLMRKRISAPSNSS